MNNMNAKRLYLNQFALKIIAIVMMTLDHIGVFLDSSFFPENSPAHVVAFVFRCFGRLALPLFLFMLAEGMHKTHDRLNYILRLALIWAPITLAEFGMGFIDELSGYALPNAFTDLLVCSLAIYLFEHPKKQLRFLTALPIAWMLFSFATLFSPSNGWASHVPSYLLADYSLFGFLLFCGFYYAPRIANAFLKKSFLLEETSLEEYAKTPDYQWLLNIISVVFLTVITVVFWLVSRFGGIPVLPLDMGLESYCIIAALFIAVYNGKRGYSKKWFQYSCYLYYPVHIVLIAGIFQLVFML